ncbi:MAG: DUF4836 family protein [Bacteroidales bacterium]
MKKYLLFIAIAAAVAITSCSKKTPAYVNSIPDEAVAVASLNPMQLRDKGKLNTIASLKEKVKDEIWGQILEDPLSTGLSLNDYVFVFAMMEEEGPVIGVVSGMKDTEKFENTLEQVKEGISSEFQETDHYKYIQPDEEGIISWNDEMMVVLASPDSDELSTEYYTGKLDWMYSPVKEESITSLVNFKEFLGKMKDLNFWVSSDDLREIIAAVAPKDMDIDLPVELYNNYAQIFIDFANGEMDINGETFFSEEVEKNVEEFLVMNPALNRDMLKLAPGENLLLAVSGSMDLEKLQKMISRFDPPQLDTLENRVESATGISGEQLMKAFTGDFAIAINSVEEEGMIPFEIFLGFGVNSKEIQDELMASVESMAPVNQEGDFFIINVQGNEIYSGILNDMWVITNSKGYKESVNAGSHQKSLINSRFNDFADGSMGMYLNLDLSSYPSMVRDLLSQNPEREHWIQQITDPFDYMGFSSSNYKSRFILKTNTPSENSLYTLVKLADHPE